MKKWQIAVFFWIGLMFLTGAFLFPIFWGDLGVYWYAGDELINVDYFAPTVTVVLGIFAFIFFLLPFLAMAEEKEKKQ